MVLPPPAETYLSDLLQFERVLDDGVTIRTKSGGLVQTIVLRGLDVGGLTAAELDAMLVRRKAWFEKVAEAGLFAKVITTRELVSYALDADYENPVLQAIHDGWTQQFQRVYSNRDYIVLTAPKDDRNAARALREAVRDACDGLSQYGPELLDNGADNFSPLLSFWASLVNGFRYQIGCFADRLSERLVANTIEFEADYTPDGRPARVPGLIWHRQLGPAGWRLMGNDGIHGL
jgi:type IV secretory pathway VirB4 component